ncbi:unnamed protein product, partial [Mesorhabditis spiculigera]
MLKLFVFLAVSLQTRALFDPSTCGSGKTCLMIPANCTTNCQQGLSYKRVSASYLEIELFSNNLPNTATYDSYMAIGFQPEACAEIESDSKTPCMASAPVIECSALNGQLMAPAVSWNTADPQNVRIDNAAELAKAVGLTMSALESNNGQTYCKLMQRITGAPLNGVANADKVFQNDPTVSYGILMATGATNGSVLTHHPHPNAMVAPGRVKF